MKTREEWLMYFDEHPLMNHFIPKILDDWLEDSKRLCIDSNVSKQQRDRWRVKYTRMAEELEEIKSNITAEGE